MARPREFDPESALDQAMQVFWAKGYDATSLDDLCDATGLGRSSLYGAFGDKHALLLQALDRYIERGAARIVKTLAGVPVHEGLANLLNLHVEEIVAGPGRRGCFVGNCTVELAQQDPKVQEKVRGALERNEASFRSALAAAQARGELSRNVDIDATARFLIASLQGLRVVGKANPDRAVLTDIARVITRCLDG